MTKLKVATRVATAAVALAALCVALAPGPLPPSGEARFLDNVFANATIVWAARVVLIAAGTTLVAGSVFTVASVIAHMRNGAWLRRAGPFEVREMALERLGSQVAYWRDVAECALNDLFDTRAEITRLGTIIDDMTCEEKSGEL